MNKQIVVIDGHPDPDPAPFCHAIAGAYAEAASTAGHFNTVHIGKSELSRAKWNSTREVHANILNAERV